jgi:hypothetical protein
MSRVALVEAAVSDLSARGVAADQTAPQLFRFL